MLRYAADWRTLFFVAIYCSLVFTIFYLWETLVMWQLILLFIAMCNMSFFSAVMVHNTIHCPIFKQRWLNKLFQYVLSFCYGHAVSAFVPGHNFSHHKYTQGEKDVMRTTKMRFKWNLLNQLFFFHRMVFDITRDEKAFAQSMRKVKPAWFRQYILELLFFFASQAVLAYINWKAFLLMVFLPHHYGVWGIVSVNFWQHDGCDPNHRYNHSRNFTGKVLNFFAFNNGFHAMHHNRPGLHWSLLPAWHQKYIAPNIHPALEQKNLMGYLWRTCVYPGKRVTYDGKPVVLPPATKDADWITELKINAHKFELGAET
jgi:beta-carotene hydroxylase